MLYLHLKMQILCWYEEKIKTISIYMHPDTAMFMLCQQVHPRGRLFVGRGEH